MDHPEIYGKDCNSNISICSKAKCFLYRIFLFLSISLPVQLILTQFKAHLEMVLNLIPLTGFINLWSCPGLQRVKRQAGIDAYNLDIGKYLLEHLYYDKTFSYHIHRLKLNLFPTLKCLNKVWNLLCSVWSICYSCYLFVFNLKQRW